MRCFLINGAKHSPGDDGTCTVCGARWDCTADGHLWRGCTCRVCGEPHRYDWEHDFAAGTTCARCGFTWDCGTRGHPRRGCVCRVCKDACGVDTSPDRAAHNWAGAECRTCGARWDCATMGHWPERSRCFCPRCNTVSGVEPMEPDWHTWSGKTCSKCRTEWDCGLLGHRWNECVCAACGEARWIEPLEVSRHDWSISGCRRCKHGCDHSSATELDSTVCPVCGLRSVRAEIVNRLGLHGRTSTRLVQIATRFQSEIRIRRDDGSEANAKSVMGVMCLVAARGAELTLLAHGPDAQEALAALREYIAIGLGEGVD